MQAGALHPLALRHNIGVESMTWRRLAVFRVTVVFVSFVFASISATACAYAQLIETKAARIHIVDAHSGDVLLSRNADTPFPPGSLAKLMTAEVVFDALDTSRLTPETLYPISEHAWRTGGAPSRTTTMFAKLKSSVSVADLLQGLTIQMANDAAIALAEGLSGSETSFAQLMNDRAKTIGIERSSFINPTGFPGDGQQVTARELSTLADHLWRKHSDQYALFSQAAFEWNKIFQRNKNPLLALDINADGLITGFAEGHGYSIVASASDGNRRVFATLGGFETEAERLSETAKLLRWGLDTFHERNLLAVNEVVGEASVYGGEKPTVTLRVEETVSVTAPISHPEAVKMRMVYDRPLPAPIKQGDKVGELQIWVGDTLSKKVALRAAEPNMSGTLSQRALGAVAELLVGWLRQFSWTG